MDESKYDQEYEYEEHRDVGVTSVGLPPGQLALIIGVNAVISLVIAISVVLLANRQVLPGDLATSAIETSDSVAQGSQPEGTTTPTVNPVEEEALPESTPLQSVSYVVEEGDTLGLIAEKFSVSLSDLMIANGLSNQDLIQIGQELTIPLAGVSTATPTFTPMLIPTETPLPFDPPTPLPADAEIPREPAVTVGPSPTPIPTSTPPPFNEINVVISEVTGAGDLVRETLVILNKGAGTSLRDWKLEGSSLGVFIFPDIFLFSGGSIRVHTAAGENTPSDLYLNQGEPAWPPGTTIILNDGSNSEMSRYVVP